jgi:hypothetical protein
VASARKDSYGDFPYSQSQVFPQSSPQSIPEELSEFPMLICESSIGTPQRRIGMKPSVEDA